MAESSMWDSRDVEVPQRAFDLLQKIGTPTLSGDLLKLGFKNHYMMGPEPLALMSNQKMIGRARTLRFIPFREDLLESQYGSLTDSFHRNALEDIQTDDVLVIDAGSCLDAAVLGDMFTRRVSQQGGTGIVIDGVLRDLTDIKTVGLPVFARGMHGAGITRALMSVGRDEPISCGGIPVIPGDVVVGDSDGVVVIPAQEAAELSEHSYDHELEEVWIREKLAEGESLHEVYPPDQKWRPILDAWKAAKKSSF